MEDLLQLSLFPSAELSEKVDRIEGKANSICLFFDTERAFPMKAPICVPAECPYYLLKCF